jgi:hypothetical protein
MPILSLKYKLQKIQIAKRQKRKHLSEIPLHLSGIVLSNSARSVLVCTIIQSFDTFDTREHRLSNKCLELEYNINLIVRSQTNQAYSTKLSLHTELNLFRPKRLPPLFNDLSYRFPQIA